MMMFRSLFLFLCLSACIEDVGKDKVAAEIVTEKTEDAQEPKAAGPGLKIDASKSTISALSAKVTAKHPIQFPEFSGNIVLDGEALKSLDFEIQMAQLQADHPKLTEHLLNEDFFDVAKYPTSTFKSTSVDAQSGENGATHVVTGDLTICGASKTIKFPATITMSPQAFNANAEFSINRQDFGINYAGRADDLIQDNVVLTISLVASR